MGATRKVQGHRTEGDRKVVKGELILGRVQEGKAENR